MDNLIKISDHAKTGLKRKVEVEKFMIDEKVQEIHFFYIIYFFNKMDESLDTFKAPIVGYKLTASNEVKVNQSGQYIEPDEDGNYPQNAIGEFDYWVNFIQNQSFDRKVIYQMVVETADQYGRFNIV